MADGAQQQYPGADGAGATSLLSSQAPNSYKDKAAAAPSVGATTTSVVNDAFTNQSSGLGSNRAPTTNLTPGGVTAIAKQQRGSIQLKQAAGGTLHTSTIPNQTAREFTPAKQPSLVVTS